LSGVPPDATALGPCYVSFLLNKPFFLSNLFSPGQSQIVPCLFFPKLILSFPEKMKPFSSVTRCEPPLLMLSFLPFPPCRGSFFQCPNLIELVTPEFHFSALTFFLFPRRIFLSFPSSLSYSDVGVVFSSHSWSFSPPINSSSPQIPCGRLMERNYSNLFDPIHSFLFLSQVK